MDMNAVPARKDGFTVREMGEEILFLDPDGVSIHVADEVGGFIYHLIDGSKDLNTVLEAILEEYDVDRKTAEEDLLAFIHTLVDQKILDVK